MGLNNGDAEGFIAPTAALNLYNPSALGLMPLLSNPALNTLAADSQSRYGFRLGNLGFLLHHDADSEVMDTPEIYRVPNCPYWMRGVVNLRGNLVPVFDIAWLLKIDRQHHENSLLLVLDKGESAAAILIDELPRAISLGSLSSLSQSPPLPDIIKNSLRKGYTQDSQAWFEFDHRNFFASLGERMRA